MSFKLNRFPADKQDQIEQLIAYAQLMGLTGADLVSIGGKMQREQIKARKEANMKLINEFQCLKIGRDDSIDLNNRFKLKTADGMYSLTAGRWSVWTVVNTKTQAKHTHTANYYEYDLPKTSHRTRIRYAMLMDIALGKFRLDF